MKKKYYIVLALLWVAIGFAPIYVLGQKRNVISVESVIKDQDGKPIPNAEVFSGRSYARTDAMGNFTILMEAGSRLVIEANGYDRITLTSEQLNLMNEIRLNSNSLLYDMDDKVNLAFRRANKGDVVGSVSVVNTAEVDEYDHNIGVSDILFGRTVGMLGSHSIRGTGIGIDVASLTGSGYRQGNALFIVDGLPRDINYIRTSEIESITVLKDVNAAILYGSAAINGVILINTKRGEAFKEKTRFSVNQGISTPRALPKYLNSADYMTYFNQARANDGLTPQFNEQTIENHRSGNKYRYPDVDYYSDEYLRSYRSYTDVVGEFSGGNNDAKFYANIGMLSQGSLVNFGEHANARNNIFNTRGNVDLKVTDWVNTSVDGTGLFVINKNARGNYWSDAATLRPHLYTPLLPFDLIDPENPLLVGRKNDVNGKYLLGGNSTNLNTPFGHGYSGGVFETIERNFGFNNRINVDLDKAIEGLSFHTNISFDHYFRYNQTVANDYSVYAPVWAAEEDVIINLVKHGVDARPGNQVVGNTFFIRRFGFYGSLNYDRVINDVHHFTGSLLGYGSNYKFQGNYQGVKQANLGFRFGYVYDKRYMVDFSGAYVNSVKLPKNNRRSLAPSLGLAWIMSSEDFMSSIGAIDLLKLRVTGGVIKSDLPIGGFFYYDNRYGTSGSYNWFDGNRSRSGVLSNFPSNPNLKFSQRNEINVGMEGLFFNRSMGIEANAFINTYTGIPTRANSLYPSYYTDFVPFENINADKYRGAELGLSYNKTINDFSMSVGVNGLYVTSERIRVDELYDNEYQNRKGRPRDATFGLEAIGFFQDENDIRNSPIQAFGGVKPGDIKYKDQNGDGVVDGNDEVYLRRWQAPLSGGVHMRLSYKGLTLFALGEGRRGSKNFLEGNYYWVDGTKKYSEMVLNSWTPETRSTATYPRLSSVTNSNNFRRSSFWLYSNDYFQLRKVQITYTLPQAIIRALPTKDINIYAEGWDLFQFAKNREIMNLNPGGEPYYRSFTMGIRGSF
jgi:TonB-linked SusC/RagA family outer membrane protein